MREKEKGRPLSTTILLMVLIFLMQSARAAGSLASYYSRLREGMRSLPVFNTFQVTSLTSCASICSNHASCIEFNLQMNHTGERRVCELSSATSTTTDTSFHLYGIPPPITTTTSTTTTSTTTTSTNITPPPPADIEYKHFDIPAGNNGCDADRGICSIIFEPGSTTDSDIYALICSKHKTSVTFNLDTHSTVLIGTNESTPEDCPPNSVIMGFDTPDDELNSPAIFKAKCQTLMKWYSNSSVCQVVTAVSNLGVYAATYKDSNNIVTWTSWMTCPYYYMAVGLRRKEIMPGVYKITSMKCCKVKETPN